MGQKITPRQRQIFVVFLLALFPTAHAVTPRLDEDTWWHLAVGKYIVEHKSLPTEDPFSRLGQQNHVPWVAYSWLHELVMFGAYRLGGLSGILALRHVLDALTILTLAWFVLRESNGRIQPLIVFAIVTATLVPIMRERPWHYTIVLTTLTLNATIEIRRGTPAWRFWWLMPAFMLWANLHVQFVLGFGVLGLGFLVTLMERWWSRRSIGRPDPALAPEDAPKQDPSIALGSLPCSNRHLVQWAGLIMACFFATLVNPYHIRIYGVIWEYATQVRVLRLVTELGPPRVSADVA